MERHRACISGVVLLWAASACSAWPTPKATTDSDEPGQRWVSKSDPDEVIVIVDSVVNMTDTWAVKNAATKAAYTITSTI